MDDPVGLTKEEVGHVFSSNPTLEEALEFLEQYQSKDHLLIT
jgi:hypothetical protein